MTHRINTRDCRVALLIGGSSAEREVSLASGEGVRRSLEEAGFPVVCFDPSSKDDLMALMEGSFDVAFICLHGKNGEDGTLQGFLEMIGVPYTGSGVLASSLAMNKSKAKEMYAFAGIPVLPSISLHKSDEYSVEEIVNQLGSRCVIKPCTEGSALGVFISEGEEEIEDSIEKAFEFDSEILIERYAEGKELTVGVLGNDETEVLPIVEIIPKSDFYDYESKYSPGAAQHICPASFDEATTAAIQKYALQAHKALGCRGVSRSDFILEGNGDCWILETNTIPGMTETSLLPDAARAAGISYTQLCTKLVELALEA